MNAQQQYGANFNVQVGENWAYMIGAWVKYGPVNPLYLKDLVSINTMYANGDYGSAKGLDLTIDWRYAILVLSFVHLFCCKNK